MLQQLRGWTKQVLWHASLFLTLHTFLKTLRGQISKVTNLSHGLLKFSWTKLSRLLNFTWVGMRRGVFVFLCVCGGGYPCQGVMWGTGRNEGNVNLCLPNLLFFSLVSVTSPADSQTPWGTHLISLSFFYLCLSSQSFKRHSTHLCLTSLLWQPANHLLAFMLHPSTMKQLHQYEAYVAFKLCWKYRIYVMRTWHDNVRFGSGKNTISHQENNKIHKAFLNYFLHNKH